MGSFLCPSPLDLSHWTLPNFRSTVHEVNENLSKIILRMGELHSFARSMGSVYFVSVEMGNNVPIILEVAISESWQVAADKVKNVW